ncbi:hypothetical protein BgAZ_104120 [Babesia gibsoni]|uniref:Uncharacterized protein n=1 Tax=Babesia gibsoni TaxID=33632 RepID=A0AAD8UT49_BABGI|nr:hypothetical protein BgAZ_104120 [Babesia gibsoni]
MTETTVSETSPHGLCLTRAYPSENELSGGQIASSTSECSSSTCDTSGSQRRSVKYNNTGSIRSPLHSLKRPAKAKAQQTCATKPRIICPDCDAMRLQLTEAKTQCYDQWISRIKILEDMLKEKQKINDEIQTEYYGQCSLVEHERNINASLKQDNLTQATTILNLRKENYSLSETLQQKDDYIEDLSEEVKKLREREQLNNQLRELDRKTIERLRASLTNSPDESSMHQQQQERRQLKHRRKGFGKITLGRQKVVIIKKNRKIIANKGRNSKRAVVEDKTPSDI